MRNMPERGGRGEIMSDELAVYEEQYPEVFADDSLVIMAEQAERRIDAVIKIKQVALKVTNGGDWVDQGGKPYLQASGAEKIGNLFNVSWRIDEPLFEAEEAGHYTYTFRGIFSMAGRSIQVEGSRSSKDPFFRQYEYQDNKKTEKSVADRDNKRDVKMAAMTNLLGNGITRLLGIRNLSYADLDACAGIKKTDIGKVEYKGKGQASTPPKRASEAPSEQQPSESGGGITTAQRRALDGMMKAWGTTDEDNLTKVSVIINRKVTDLDEMTKGEASKVIGEFMKNSKNDGAE